MTKNPNWTSKEDGLLNETYPHFSNIELMQFFPGRTNIGIQKRALRLNLSKSELTLKRIREKSVKAAIEACKKGKYKTVAGYVLIHAPGHLSASKKGYMLEHRLVMEKHLGRYLMPKEIVHHINGIKDDNRIENLELTTSGIHTTQHHIGAKRSSETKAKISQKAKQRLADKRNHPEYRAIDPAELKGIFQRFKSVKTVCRYFGFTGRTFYNKLDELGLREWYANAQ